MNKAPAFQFYPDKFLAGTEHLSDKAFRIYTKLMCWMWLHSPDHYSIKNEESFIRRQLKISKSVYASAWVGEIMDTDRPLLAVDGELLICKGLAKEAEKQAKRHKQTSDAAYARWKKSERISHASAKRCPTTPSPTTNNPPTPQSDDVKGEGGSEERNDNIEQFVPVERLAWAKTEFSAKQISDAWEYTIQQWDRENVHGTLETCFAWALKNGKRPAKDDGDPKTKIPCPLCKQLSRPEMEGCEICSGVGHVFLTAGENVDMMANIRKEDLVSA